MQILITGGAGFIGSHLCERFLSEGHSVICIDNFVTGNNGNIRPFLSNSKFEFVKHDISKYINIKDKVDYVLHFASPASPIDYYKYPIETLEVGSFGTHNALDLAKAKSAKFLLASTSEVYGDPLVHPQPESYLGNVNCIGPRSVYDEAKRFSEAITMAYHRKYKIDTKIIRIFNTYGQRMRENDGRAIPAFISQALANKPITVFGDGSQTRSFCFISDMVEGILKLMDSKINDPVNIGNPKEYTMLELANQIIKLTGAKSKIVFQPLPVDDPKRRKPDIGKATEFLKWAPKVKLEEGLTKTIEWFKDQK